MNNLLEFCIFLLLFIRHRDKERYQTDLAGGTEENRTDLFVVILIRMFHFIGVNSLYSECVVTGGYVTGGVYGWEWHAGNLLLQTCLDVSHLYDGPAVSGWPES